MPATPAWPPKSLPRLFVRAPLSEGAQVDLDPAQANYLGNVLRMGAGAELLIFDGSSGEWLARIAKAGKKRMTLAVERRTREPETIPDVWLAFAPVKRAQTDWLVEKATELGAARLIPVLTQRTVAERVKLERLATISIEAAEQCGRTRLPDIAEPETIPDLWLAFAPVKRAQTDWLVEKATELGAARLMPVITHRTVAERVKLERLATISIEAAEQCGRTRLPVIAEPLQLARLLDDRDAARTLYFADEGGGEPAAAVFKPGPALLLTGPEGGFTDEERALVRSAPNSVAVSLGPRILRAETAALAALAAYMAVAGDWRP